jgi:hypothetical protein
MSDLTRYDPFSMEPMSELFQGLVRPLRGTMTGEEAALSDMKIDVAESDTAYTVNAELPGVDKNDIDVNIDGNVRSSAACLSAGRAWAARWFSVRCPGWIQAMRLYTSLTRPGELGKGRLHSMT